MTATGALASRPIAAEEGYKCAHCGVFIKSSEPHKTCEYCKYWAHYSCGYECPKKPAG